MSRKRKKGDKIPIMGHEPYRQGGDYWKNPVQGMLLAIHQFPEKHWRYEVDEIRSAYSDRFRIWPDSNYDECIREHCGKEHISDWVRRSDASEVMAFLKDIFRAKGDWTGFRVLSFVNTASGIPYLLFELFKMGEGSVPLIESEPVNVQIGFGYGVQYEF